MFGHLQIYSSYSFQQSTILIEDLVKDAASKHIDALALTDQDNMFGMMEFNKACLKYHIRPIFGLEASIMIEDGIYPFTLLARDDQGYFELLKITSKINLSKEHAIAIEELVDASKHLYIISASKEGIIPRLILKESEDRALEYLKYFHSLFLNHYYIMIQNHHIKQQTYLNERLISLANVAHVKVICSNEVCYLKPSDALTVDLMKAAKEERQLDYKYQPITTEKYLKTLSEMEPLFSKEIIEETKQVVLSCKATIPLNQRHLPSYPVPHNAKASDYLQSLCVFGLKKRFKNQNIPQEYINRLNYELSIIHQMGFDDYFLIVWDYVNYAKNQHILVGPGRGSAAGSLVAYVLEITNVNPIQYGLFFERFLNPERVSMPDIDIDFQDDRREEVVEYVRGKYGEEHVAHIITFTTYGPRVAIKDIGKVMNIPMPRLEILAKMVPTQLKFKKTITEMYQTSAQFQSMVNQDPLLKKVLPAMSVVEHLPRNISKNAAGVVLSKEPLQDVIPLIVGPSMTLMSQYSKDYIEEAGLLKMDFLAIRNLTMIDTICKAIYKDTHKNITMNTIPLNDQKTFDLLSKGDTYGLFQLESHGMRQLLRQLKPHCIEDIVDAIALFRPGPMKNIPTYIKRRNKQEPITYPLDELEPILKSTQGILIYQEQLMQVAQKVAGFSLGKADSLRKACSKKEIKLMQAMKEEFIAGCLKHGLELSKANELYDLIERFADYGFNKSHSVAYSYVAYPMAYLKANYPIYFYAAVLSNEASSVHTKMNVIQECRRLNIQILPPSVNYSYDRFIVEDGKIRYSLLAIKNIGYADYKAIEAEREKGLFTDIFDFMRRIKLSSSMLEALIDAGALGEFGKSRQTLLHNLKNMLDYSYVYQRLGVAIEPIINEYKDDENDKLEREKNVLGIYLTMHPIELKKQKVPYRYLNVASLYEYIGKNVNVVIQLTKIKNIVDRKGQEMCFIEGIDETGLIDGVVFARQFKQVGIHLKKGNICLIHGRIELKDQLSLIVEDVKVID